MQHWNYLNKSKIYPTNFIFTHWIIPFTLFYICFLCNQDSKARVYWSALHGSHDLIEENPVGQPDVASLSALGRRVHLHVLAVEPNTLLRPHHHFKELNLWQQKGKKKVVFLFARYLTQTEREAGWGGACKVTHAFPHRKLLESEHLFGQVGSLLSQWGALHSDRQPNRTAANCSLSLSTPLSLSLSPCLCLSLSGASVNCNNEGYSLMHLLKVHCL